MSNLCNSHSIQLSDIEIYILSLILEHIDFELELELKGGTKASLSDIKEKISQTEYHENITSKQGTITITKRSTRTKRGKRR
jgi:hypothetical protein